MDQEIKDEMIRLQETSIGEILTLAEIGLQPEQFRQFKKKVFKVFHDHMKPETIRLLYLFDSRSVQKHILKNYSGQGRATTDSFEGKEVPS